MIENLATWLALAVLEVVGKIGYLGITLLMALESSFIPFPSEIVIPPAAYLAQQGQFNIYLVILSGIIGSLLGALFNYYLALRLGRKVVYGLARYKFFRFLLINPAKIEKSEKYFLKYGNISTFIGRLVPVLRQLVSLPAGFSKMSLKSFLFYTFLGSGIWTVILAILGYVFGSNQEKFEKYYTEISWFFIILIPVLVIVLIIKKSRRKVGIPTQKTSGKIQ